jgi:3-deoxy-D-manno-octulosonic-acid transferase
MQGVFRRFSLSALGERRGAERLPPRRPARYTGALPLSSNPGIMRSCGLSAGEAIYGGAMRVARPLARLLAPAHRKLARGVAGRRAGLPALERWAAAERGGGPLVWVHAPSVGESLMAQAIIGELRSLRPGVRIVFTHFSPSAERVAARVGADFATYLPWDVPAEVGRALQALRPEVLAFVRTEVWPVLGREAARRGTRVALVNGILPAASSRTGRAARFFLRSAYARLDRVGAVSAADAERFATLGVPASRLVQTGDARFDQVWLRLNAAERAGAVVAARLREERPTLVAGSTWPPDEERLLPAFARYAAARSARLIIAPHEPDEAHLRALEQRLEREGLDHARLSRVEPAGVLLPSVVVVDRVGVLADLYAAGDVAYVGGGFHRAGLHSVVEPAALGVPVLFGPRHGNAREAAELIAAGGGFAVADADAAALRLGHLLDDRAARDLAGAAAAAYVKSRLGGARRNAALIADLIARAAG